MMDRSDHARRRTQGVPQPSSKTPIRIARDKTLQQKFGYDSPEEARKSRVHAMAAREREARPVKTARGTSTEADEDASPRNFTVTNVGAGGRLYLKPSRIPQAVAPARVADEAESAPAGRSDYRRSSASGMRTPQAQNVKPGQDRPRQPPLSLANPHQRRRTRSHSFSTLNDCPGSSAFDPTALKILLNGRRESSWRKSSIELREGLLDLKIPHYKLGTPRFSERGTAYLHNSVYTMATDDMRSSVFSRGEFHKIFPAPPGRATVARTSSSPYLQPDYLTQSVTPSASSPIFSEAIQKLDTEIYDTVEENTDDPSLVRYSSTTGRITAATIPRLLAQITSPVFLDYELLSDFFLVFRNFSTCGQLLTLLMARMKWALYSNSDNGRIVRVRTFVAIRHWILNYFTDDFMFDLQLRQQFCDLVNGLFESLRQRADKGGSDANIVSELKKCWRRVCAMFWPVDDALTTSPDLDINPGGVDLEPAGDQEDDKPPSTPPQAGPRLSFCRSSVIRLPPTHQSSQIEMLALNEQGADTGHVRTASIPTSPMSSDSMDVLSCSVPFLRVLHPTKAKSSEKKAKDQSSRPPLVITSGKSTRGHKRSGSFTDALRDKRILLPRENPETEDCRPLRDTTFTGGLVRGLLLQPCSSKVDVVVPLSPALEATQSNLMPPTDTYPQDRLHQNAGMRRFVGDVRRALSNRKGQHHSPSSSQHSTISCESRQSIYHIPQDMQRPPSAWQQLRGQSRVDMLGAAIEEAYAEAFHGQGSLQADDYEDYERAVKANNERAQPGRPPIPLRSHSHVTTSSRSIVIVDDTQIPEIPKYEGALPSATSWGSARHTPQTDTARGLLEAIETRDIRPSELIRDASLADFGERLNRRSSEPELQGGFSYRDDWHAGQGILGSPSTNSQARASSGIHPQDAPHQLRRRPGGNLKAAGHVHDLETVARPGTTGTFSTMSDTLGSPCFSSPGLSGTHFSGQRRENANFSMYESNKDSLVLMNTHSSQPNIRPSLEKDMSRLAELPERAERGGIDDALAKLEGKSSSDTALNTPPEERRPGTQTQDMVTQKPHSAPLALPKYPLSGVGFSNPTTLGTEIPHPGIDRLSQSEADSNPSQETENMSDDLRLRSQFPVQAADSAISSQKSVGFALHDDVAVVTPTTDLINSHNTHMMDAANGSFLLDDNESLSDISTEIAEHSGDEGLDVRSFFFDDTVDDDPMLMRPFRPPPTPPSTLGVATYNSPHTSDVSQLPQTENQQLLKGVQSTPALMPSREPASQLEQDTAASEGDNTAPAGQQDSHLPFVLAYDSEVIAEQFTIIEKDAIDEIDWKDLVGLRWRQTPPKTHNWVDFLKQEQANGTELVVARFNIMVKWIASECVLTDSVHERARCIAKYIHIATHTHRLRNYPTTYQITLALTSTDIARLQRTWALVPAAEKETLATLERLCNPIRNFHSLRTEMEMADAQTACIPFIGLYMHDLMFNAQKPARMEGSPPGAEPLVNFARFQTAATIVKSLLRLIESSSQFIFRPQPEVLSRCLWMATLSDSEIAAKSRALEPCSYL